MPTATNSPRSTTNDHGTVIISAGGGEGSAEALEDHGHALAAADAHGLEAELLVPALQAVEQRGGDPRAGGAERVALRDRAAVHVEPVEVDAQVLVRRDDLGREGLVDLDQVHVVDRHAGQ